VNIKFKHLQRGQTAQVHTYINSVAVTSVLSRVSHRNTRNCVHIYSQ